MNLYSRILAKMNPFCLSEVADSLTKGQMKSKSRLAHRRFLLKKEWTNLIFLPSRVKKQIKQIHPFIFWENLWRTNLLSK